MNPALDVQLRATEQAPVRRSLDGARDGTIGGTGHPALVVASGASREVIALHLRRVRNVRRSDGPRSTDRGYQAVEM